MPEVLQNLNANLKKQVSFYEKIFIIEENKQKALLSNDLKELDKITGSEEQLMIEACNLEKERLLWAEQIGQYLGKAPEDLTLAELADHFPVLEEVRLELDQVVNRLKEIHELNTQLLEQAMKVVDFTIGMLTHQEKSTYNHPGRKSYEENGKLRLLDRRI